MGCVVTTSVLEVSMMAEICNGITATWAKSNMERRRSKRRFKKMELADKVNCTVKSLAVTAAAPAATSATQGKLIRVAAKSMEISSTLASSKENLPSQLVRQAASAAADG